MIDIIDINERRPHEAAIVQCENCWRRHIAVFPVAASFPLECGSCGKIACTRTYESLED